MKPLCGNSNDTQGFGEIIERHIDQLQTTYGVNYLVADCALYIVKRTLRSWLRLR